MRKQTKKLDVKTETVRPLVRPLANEDLQAAVGGARCCSRAQSGCVSC